MPKNMPPAHKDKSLCCGHCRWFETPYRGKNCQVRRKVIEITPACEEYEKGNYNPDIMDILKDPFFKKLDEKLRSSHYQLDKGIETEIKEFYAESLKGAQFNHRFNNPNQDMSNLSKLFEKTQASRDRLNSIAIDVTGMLNRYLYPLRTLAKGKILTSFSSTMGNWKSMDDRNSIVSLVTDRLEKRISRVENILEIVELAIKNLDQNYWSLKAIKEIGEGIITRRMTDANIQNRGGSRD